MALWTSSAPISKMLTGASPGSRNGWTSRNGCWPSSANRSGSCRRGTDVGFLALLIPIVSVGGFFAWMIALSPVGKAYAEKLKGQGGMTGEAGEQMLQAIEGLRQGGTERSDR